MSDVTPIVFIVDGDTSVRASLEVLLKGAGLRSAFFPSAHDFLAHHQTSAPCCLVLDVELPDLDGLELQARVASERKEMPLVFIASCRDVRTTVRAMKAGALEFLTKPFDGAELLSAVRHAIELSRSARAFEAGLRILRDRFDTLTSRERAVMALVVSGRLNKQVGAELGISEITVKAHRGSAMRTMQADSLAQLVDMARRLGVPIIQRAGRSRYNHAGAHFAPPPG
ncbi:MAG: response regulator [Steroidobacteraceae bacterium]